MRTKARSLTVSSALVALLAAGAHAASSPAPTPQLPFAPTGALGRLDVAEAGRTVVFDTSTGRYSVDGVVRNARPVSVSMPSTMAAAGLRSMWAFDFTSIRLGAGTRVTVRGTLPLLLLSQGRADIATPLRLDGERGANGGVGAGGGGGGGAGAVAVFARDTLTVTGTVSVRGGAGGIGNSGTRVTSNRAYDGGPGAGGSIVLGSATQLVLDAPVVTLSGDAKSAGPVTVVGDVRYGAKASVNALAPQLATVASLPALPHERFLLAGGGGGGGGGGSGLPEAGPAGYARVGSPGGIAGAGGGDGGASGYAMAGGSGGRGGNAGAGTGAGGGGGGGGGAYSGGGGLNGNGNAPGAPGGPGGPGGAGRCGNAAAGGPGGAGGAPGGGAGGNGGSVTAAGVGSSGASGGSATVAGAGGGGGGGGGDACRGNAPGAGGAGGAGMAPGGQPGGSGRPGRNVPRGRLCSYSASSDPAPDADDNAMTGQVNGGPLVWSQNFWLHCHLQVDNNSHTGPVVPGGDVHGPSDPHSNSDEEVAIVTAQVVYESPEDSQDYLCTSVSWPTSTGPNWLYWHPGNDGPDGLPGTEDDQAGDWTSNSTAPCSAATQVSTGPVIDAINDVLIDHVDPTLCRVLAELHHDENEVWGDRHDPPNPPPGHHDGPNSSMHPTRPGNQVIYIDAEGDVFIDDGDGDMNEPDWPDDLWWDCPSYVDYPDPGADGASGSPGVYDY